MRGLNVRLEKLKELIDKVAYDKVEIEQELRKKLGIKGELNFNSSGDIAPILWETMGIQLTKGRSGRFIANQKTLRNFNTPLTDSVAQYRKLEKLLSSLKAFFDATDEPQGKIFCTYTDDCPSGRLYTKNYNVQGISELGRCAIYPDGGCSFVLADYDSFELRILSALAGDRYFKDCWSKGLDLHRKVVSDMKNIPYDSVTDKERKLGKCLNFGQSYGQEPAGLARNLHVSVAEASELMDSYKSNIPEIEKFKRDAIRFTQTTGYTETYHGRKRLLPEIYSTSFVAKKKAERQAVNTKIQGSASDIVKFSMVKLHNDGFKIDTMIHDSILMTIPDGEIKESAKRIKEIMEIEIEGMRFPVSIKIGKTWGECLGNTENHSNYCLGQEEGQ